MPDDARPKPKKSAYDNPWYILATLYQDPSETFDTRARTNRAVWNRLMASKIDDDLQDQLIKAGRYSADELHPLQSTPAEMKRVEAEFSKRYSKSSLDEVLRSELDFSCVGFFDEISFTRFLFPKAVTFKDATFTEFANFTGATFAGAANFTYAKFSPSFEGATFMEEADFGGASFGIARFEGATFVKRAGFEDVTFSLPGIAANFARATFADVAYFQRAIFKGGANFINAEMKHRMFFVGTKFGRPPLLYNAKLHEGTTWHGSEWPAPPKDICSAVQFAEAYERLKLEMDKLKKHGDELDFFARELQCRRVVLGFRRGLPFAIYGLLSDYGRSYVRPLSLLVATVVVGTIFYIAHLGGFWSPALSPDGHAGEAIGISFASALSLLGRPFIDANALQKLPDWLKAVSTLQATLGIVLLFLFGLGIRNRFRMK